MSSGISLATNPVNKVTKLPTVDLELGFQGYNGSWSKFDNLKSSDNEAMFDLQLSLSTGRSHSAITNAADSCQNSLEDSVTVCPLKSNDKEGSSSFFWVFGSFLGPSSATAELSICPSSNQKPSTEFDSTAAVTGFPSALEQTVACTSGFLISEKRKCGPKKCQFLGCGKGARGGSGLCIAHGGGRRCQRPGCQRGAEGKTVYCKSHGGGRRCEHLGCTKSAEGRTDFCIAHGGGRRCMHEGCSHAARGKSGFCIKHGGGKRCEMENCVKSTEGSSRFCIAHGGGRRCQFPGCSKGAQGSTMLCKAHGGGNRCTFLGCTKGAEGSTSFCKGHGGGKRCLYEGGGVCPKSVHGGSGFCVAHGGGKRCAFMNCTKSARGRTDFCVRHGGGKRCVFEGCGKSAQGSADFCKAHGGGNRCSWGRINSQFGGGDQLPCDKFARTKSGLCNTHNALLQDQCVHGGGKHGLSAVLYQIPVEPEEIDNDGELLGMKLDNNAKGFNECSSFGAQRLACSVAPSEPELESFLEGRVHGGGLMAMRVDDPNELTDIRNKASASTSGEVTLNSIMHRWM